MADVVHDVLYRQDLVNTKTNFRFSLKTGDFLTEKLLACLRGLNTQSNWAEITVIFPGNF